MASRNTRHSSCTAPTSWNGWTVKRFAGGSKIGGLQLKFCNIDYAQIFEAAFKRQRSIPAAMHVNGIVEGSRQTACRELSQNSRPRCGWEAHGYDAHCRCSSFSSTTSRDITTG
jgi:hypothetical protein